MVRLLPDADGPRRPDGVVFTTFFITGLMTFATYRTIPRLRSVHWGWFSYLVMVAGMLLTAGTILWGNATVLYTFYAPLKAHPAFYFGATLLNSRNLGCRARHISQSLWYRRTHPGQPLPLPSFLAGVTSRCGSSRRSASWPRWRC